MSDEIPSNEPAPVLPGAEAWSHDAGPGAAGALVIHGFTGNPSSMRGLAEAFAAAGFTVLMPRLPGHGTTVEDMMTTGWVDWSASAEAAYLDLAARSKRVVVAGLSMGGTLTLWLATRHPEIAGIVLVNPAAALPNAEFNDVIQGLVDGGDETMDAIGSDVAMEGVVESAYAATPLRPLLSLTAAIGDLSPRLSEVRCPVLLMNSPQDHVVPPAAADHVAASVSGPVERLILERSFHVATIDHDAPEIEQRAVAFAARVTAT